MSIDIEAWQESWDRQQEAYLPDREQRFAAMLDVLEAVVDGPAPRVLDLAGGTGSIGLRVLRRFPQAAITLVDQDPVLLTLAEASLGEGAHVVTADLGSPGWVDALPGAGFDAVFTATALHWLDGPRVAALYGELRDVLRPGGVFVNADHMPEQGLPDLTKRMVDRADQRREARYAAGAALSWQAWWERVAAEPEFADALERRRQVYPEQHGADWMPPAQWHLDTLHAAGFTEAGLIWRGGPDAAVAGVR